MSRLRIGAALLAISLAAGIWSSRFLENNLVPAGEDLQLASQLVLQHQWGQAEALSGRARKNWQKKWRVTAAFADHEPMDEIDGIFAQLAVCARVRDSLSYSSTCAVLAEKMKALGQAYRFSWWNLL